MTARRSRLEGTTLDTDEARRLALQYFKRHFDRVVLIGQVSLWVGHGYSLRECEELLNTLAEDGFIRLATAEELRNFSVRHGYFLTEDGLERIRASF